MSQPPSRSQSTSTSHTKPKSKSKSKPNQKHQPPTFTPIPSTFTAKKSQILASISVPADTYTDKSPKGSIDAPIVEFIDEINGIDGLVTTSSCSGRVAVFVEGPRRVLKGGRGERSGGGDGEESGNVDDGGDGQSEGEEEGRDLEVGQIGNNEVRALVTTNPGGKGGGHWLFVSHEPVDIPSPIPPGYFTRLCGLSSPSTSPSTATHLPVQLDTHQQSQTSTADVQTSAPSINSAQSPRLIHLLFSPLILHIHTATLSHAKPLLSAAMNAGFRESGVQSLRVLEDPDVGVTIGIRTAGLAFECIIGVLREHESPDGSTNGEGVHESLVSEEYLRLMFEVINERFRWNLVRKERLRAEILRGFGLQGAGNVADDGSGWESREDRARRKREEGLEVKRRKEMERQQGVQMRGKEKGVEMNGEEEIGEEGKLILIEGGYIFPGAVNGDVCDDDVLAVESMVEKREDHSLSEEKGQ